VTNSYIELESLNEEIINCHQCPRLVEWRESVARLKRKAYADWEYWGKPVPGFGDARARILVLGLAPGAHGSNRTGRQFTGDGSGDFLFPALHRVGFASLPRAYSRNDGLTLQDVYITATVRCAPPGNKPEVDELHNCQPYLVRELNILKPRVIVCLGRVAFDRILRIFSVRDSSYKFGHGSLYRLDAQNEQPPSKESKALIADYRTSRPWLLCSYHPSRQNTSTGKLNAEMFDEIWQKARALMDSE